jgi:Bacterial Ig-like domain
MLVRTGVETKRPTVVATSPADGATAVPAFGSPTLSNIYQPFIWVGFSEPISPTTLMSQTLHIRDRSGRQLNSQVFYDAATNSARLLLAEPLNGASRYTVTLTTGVFDSSGNALASNRVWSFSTATYTYRAYMPVVMKRRYN